MTIEVVNMPAFGPVADRLHFSQGVKAGGLMFCSGVIGTGADGKVPGALRAEFRAAFEGVKAVLGEAGLTTADIVEMTTYHVDMQETMPAFVAVRDEYLSAPWCAWSAIGFPPSRCAVPTWKFGWSRNSTKLISWLTGDAPARRENNDRVRT